MKKVLIFVTLICTAVLPLSGCNQAETTEASEIISLEAEVAASEILEVSRNEASDESSEDEYIEYSEESEDESSEDTVAETKFSYYILDKSAKTAEIRGYILGDDTNITIPSEIDGYTIISIADSTFQDDSELTGVIICDGIESIGESAFENCASLESVTISDSVTSMGYKAFCNCTGLTSVEIGNGLTAIEDCAFNSCAKLKSVIIPDSVEVIGLNAFCWCTSLSSVTIGSGVTTIEYGAFDQTNITEITIPASVTTLSGSFLSRHIEPENSRSAKDYTTEGITIYGYEKSSAYYYAKNNNITFVCLDE